MTLLTIQVNSAIKERLDKYVANNSEFSRSMVQKLAKESRIYLNNKVARVSDMVVLDDIITIEKPEIEKTQLKPEKIDLELIYEDQDLLVINKPQGMVVHPSKGHESGTLVNALLGYCMDLSKIGGEIRPGIVHRLDKDTSGLLLVAKNDKTHKRLSLALKKHEIKRVYVAVVKGRMDAKEGTISAPISRHPKKRTSMAVVEGGRNAVTHFKVLHLFKKNSFVRLDLETGRTHQIRVHLAFAGHPVLGDVIYNPNAKNEDGVLMLHAAKLEFMHPITKKAISLTAPLPARFRTKLRELY